MYLFKIDKEYTVKNKLQKDILQFIRTQNRKTFDSKGVKNHIKMISESIDKLNESNRRCLPLKLNITGNVDLGFHDIQIYIFDLFYGSYYKSLDD